MKNMCTTCSKRSTCRTLCKPARDYANQDGKVYELQDEDKIKVYPKWNEVQASTAQANENDSKEVQENYLESFADDPDSNPFSEFTPANLVTQVFIHRFFKRWSYEDIAVKFDLKDVDAANSIYKRALARMKDGLEIIDHKNFAQQNAITSLKNSTTAQQLNDAQKDYLLYSTFGLDIESICTITGRKYQTVRSGIHRVKKYLESGRFSFEDLAIPGQWEKTAKSNALAGLRQNRKTA